LAAVGVVSQKTSCQGKLFIATVKFGTTRVFNRPLQALYYEFKDVLTPKAWCAYGELSALTVKCVMIAMQHGYECREESQKYWEIWPCLELQFILHHMQLEIAGA